MTDRTIVAWIVPLKGHVFDLEDLPIYLDGSAVSIVKREDCYFLRLSSDVTGPTYERVGQLALGYIELINGAASVLIKGHRAIEVTGGPFYGIDAVGAIANTVVPLGTAELRCKGGHVTVVIGGVARPDVRRGAMVPLLREAARHSAKADALTIMGRTSPSWSELYLVFELVQANVGSHMYSEGWISRSEATLFSRTANSYTALGRTGRHGRDRGNPPTSPMSQGAAVALMRSLVSRWLNESSAPRSDAQGAGCCGEDGRKG